jgi:predicted Zn-dependent protease
VIRLVTFEPFERELLDQLSRAIFQAYGLGCEYAGEVPLPEKANVAGGLDAVELVTHATQVKSFADDKVIYLTARPFAPRRLPSGELPTQGFSQAGGSRAVLTTHGLPQGAAFLKRLSKQAVHEVGHLWELHHCLDARCAMYPPWAMSFATGEATLCTFCREKSEQKIRLAKT